MKTKRKRIPEKVDTGEILITLPRRKAFQTVSQFKITLLDTDPPVWRRIQVPGCYTFYELHVAIQDAMGWMDSHLHAFEFRHGRRLNQGVRIECPFGVDEIKEEDPRFSTEIEISRLFHDLGARCLYIYDFGDNWEHDIVFEGDLHRETNVRYPVCIDGALSCPPEDCGGIPGYYRCIEVLRRQDDSEGLLSWLGRWKPDAFRPERVKFWNPRTRLKMALEG
jgi:hypothetical protein